MDQTRFTSPNGVLTQGIGGYAAFVPAPLFPVIDWTGPLVRELSMADQALGKLAGVGQSLVNPQLLLRPFLKREAVLSSRIEGTVASLSDLFYFEAAPASSPATSDVGEVANYVRALELGLKTTAKRPLGLNVLREMHSVLMDGVRGGDRRPGEFRRDRNWIGPPGCRLDEATYVPPAPEDLPALLDAFEKAIHRTEELPPLVLKLIDELFDTPVVTIPGAMKFLGVTYHSAQDNIESLVEGGILRETTGRKRDRVYMARQILQAVERHIHQGPSGDSGPSEGSGPEGGR